MEIDLETEINSSSRIRVSGEVDLYSSGAFLIAVMGQLSGSAPGVELDLTEMDYLDSSGVGALIRILQKTKALNKTLKIEGLGGTPLKVLRMCNVLDLLNKEGCIVDHKKVDR